MNKPLVSIIILNRDGGKITQNCLKSVLRSHYPNLEIILVDNASSEKEVKKLEKIDNPKIKLILNNENYGYAHGNNLGADKARGKYLVFLNNDTIVPFNWLRKPIKKMEEDSRIAFLQPKIKWLKNKKFFEYAGGAGGFIDYFGFPFARGRIFGSIEEDINQYNDCREIFWASGVALFCRKDIFDKLGRFDPFLFAYAEEGDICFRAHRSGYKVIYYPNSSVFHLGAYTAARDAFRKVFFQHRNHPVLLLKNLKFRELVFIIPPRIAMDLSAIFYYLFHAKNPSLAWAIIVAYGSIIKNASQILKNRSSYGLKNFGYPQKPGLVYKGSLVWQYFIMRKKRWSELFGESEPKGKVIKLF